MASTEQLLKKRKLYDTSSTYASPPPPPPPSHYPVSHEEILQKRRNKEEIRSLNESYRRIRLCISQKDARLMPDFEQAYLSLITASGGMSLMRNTSKDNALKKLSGYIIDYAVVDKNVGKHCVNFREPVIQRAEFDYLHKKQSGGQGQYGRVCGGSLIGHPVENVHVVLTNGAAHTVDSSKLAFKLAAIYAFRHFTMKAPWLKLVKFLILYTKMVPFSPLKWEQKATSSIPVLPHYQRCIRSFDHFGN